MSPAIGWRMPCFMPSERFDAGDRSMDSRRVGIRASNTAGFEKFDFTHDRKTKRVLRHGAGPGVLPMHELPGMTPACLYLAKRIAGAGFSGIPPTVVRRAWRARASDVAFRWLPALPACARGLNPSSVRGRATRTFDWTPTGVTAGSPPSAGPRASRRSGRSGCLG